MKKILILIMAVLMLSGCTLAKRSDIRSKEVDYSADGAMMKGYLAYDNNAGSKRPGVLVVHEWWGLNDYARKRAHMLAEMGYTALAVDMYGEGKQAAHPDDAKKFSSELMANFDVARGRFLAALEYLKKQPSVDPKRIAAIGYCFGGGVVLNMARQGIDLRGAASFHGGLSAVQPAKQGAVKAKLLVLNGADDKFIPTEQIAAFKQEMKDAGADLEFISYPGALHSFTNPDADKYAKEFNMPVAYNAEADRKSWKELRRFLRKIFK